MLVEKKYMNFIFEFWLWTSCAICVQPNDLGGCLYMGIFIHSPGGRPCSLLIQCNVFIHSVFHLKKGARAFLLAPFLILQGALKNKEGLIKLCDPSISRNCAFPLGLLAMETSAQTNC